MSWCCRNIQLLHSAVGPGAGRFLLERVLLFIHILYKALVLEKKKDNYTYFGNICRCIPVDLDAGCFNKPDRPPLPLDALFSEP